MAAGKQPESLIVHWHPDDSSGTDGLGIPGASLPVAVSAADRNYVDDITISGVSAAITTAEGYTNILYHRMVASGFIDFAFGT